MFSRENKKRKIRPSWGYESVSDSESPDYVTAADARLKLAEKQKRKSQKLIAEKKVAENIANIPPDEAEQLELNRLATNDKKLKEINFDYLQLKQGHIFEAAKKKFFELISQHKYVEKINLNFINFDCKDIKSLVTALNQRKKPLLELHLANLRFGNEGLIELANLRVSKLVVSANNIDGNGVLKYMLSITQPIEIDLSDNHIDSNSSETITHINAITNKLTGKSIESLRSQYIKRHNNFASNSCFFKFSQQNSTLIKTLQDTNNSMNCSETVETTSPRY